MHLETQVIRTLSLMTSCGCNLQCEYCKIAQSVNDNSAFLQKATIEALQNGSFIQNTLKVLDKINQSPAQITRISLWGQEPTLTLQYITANIDKWFEAFPNLQGIMFSSNMIDFPERILDLTKTLEEKAPHHFSLDIQFSFDGEESTNNIRNANSQKIYNNIAFLFTEWNKINFKKLNISCHYHGVVSIELINRLQNTNQIINYYDNLNDWANSLCNLLTNKAIEVFPVVGLSLENPVDATSEDGINLARFVEISLRQIHKNNQNKPYHNSPIETLLEQYSMIQRILIEYNISSIPQLLEKMAKDSFFKKEINDTVSHMLFCGNGMGELKLMYDGSCINCQNSIFEQDSKFISNDGSRENIIKKALADNGYFINILTATDEEIYKYFDLFKASQTSTFSFLFQETIILMWWLLQAKQISESYYNLQKLIYHAFILAWINSCYYNHYIKTGSMFIKHTGIIRFYCNGFMDQIVHFMETHKLGGQN